MNDAKFKEVIYGPYAESWKIIKLLQHCSKTNNHENWEMFEKECDRFCKAANNPFSERLAGFLVNAAEDIATMNEGDV